METTINGVCFRILPDADGVARLAARTLEETVRAAAGAGRRALVALSGGSTPKRLYQLLAAEPPGKIDWGSVEIFFGDERAVPPDHADSNYHMAREALLSRVPIPPGRIHRMAGEDRDLQAAARRYAEELADAAPAGGGGAPSLDLIWLGMGDDGHTASLFPGTPALREEALWVAANEVPQLGTRRLTLTFPVLRAARRLQFLVSGAGKAARVAEIAGSLRSDAPAGQDLPPAARARAAAGGITEWVLDAAAAGGLGR